MSVFNPTLETEIRYEQPVQAPRQFSPVAALADTATQALKVFDASRPTQAGIASAQLAEFGDEINRAIDLKEQGKPFKSNLNKAAVKLVTSGIKDVPAELKSLYSGVSGVDFDAIGYQDEGEYQKSQILSSEKATALAASVRAQNPNFTSEEVDSEVLQSLTETAFLDQQVALQNARAAAGLDVKTTPIVESIQNDFDILAGKVAEFQADGIVTREEYLSATTSVRSLISAKYSNFNNNPEVKSIQDQMFGMLDDIGKGVSTDPLDVQLDTIQVALTRSDFSPATIATIRSLIKTNPDSFRQILEKQLGERGDSFVDALDKIWSAPSEELKLEDIFGTNTPPPIASSAGENPSLMEIPNVADNPEEYQKVVEGLGTVTSTTKPVNIINSEETRNAWLNSMNVVSSLVASQSYEYIMGDKLLSVFSSNGVVANLDSVYRTDPMNAAQTNDGLQKALISERTRQNNELNQRLGRDDSYFRVDGDRLVLNVDFLRSKMGDVPQGDRRIAAIEAANARIEQVGGLESFLKLPQNRRDEILEGSNLERILDTRFGQTIKLFNNLKLIDKKLGSLVQLEKKYSSATDLFRGSDELDAFARQALQDVMNDDRIFSQTLDSLGPDQPQASPSTSISDATFMATMRAVPPSTEGSPPSPLGDVEVPSQEMPIQAPELEGSAPEVFENVRGLTSQLGQDLPLNLGTTTSTEASDITRESQRRLKDIGFYRDAVDGISGDQTDNAIKTFQHENNLEVTGQLDENTRLKLAETGLSKRPEISDSNNALLNFIGKGESGGYGAANDYNNGRTQFGVKDSYFSERYQKPLDKLTVSEVQDIQSGGYGTREVFAVGAYQIIPDTLNEAVAALGLTGNEVFDQALQDRIAIEYLAADKRPKLRDWLNGVEGVTREEAAEAFAQEWASVPLLSAKTRVVNGVTHNLRRGESYYKPEGNNADAHTPEELERLLDSLRS